MSSSRVRQLREDDGEAVAALFLAGHGEARRMDGDEIREWLANESLKPENLLVVERDGRVVAYFDLWFEPDGTVDLDLTAPDMWEETLAEGERIARERGAARVRTYVPQDGAAEDAVRARGYEVIRSTWTMEIELGVEAPREAAPPEGVEIRPYRHPEDEERVWRAHTESFADHWGYHAEPIEQWREFTVKSRTFDPTLWFVAWAGDEVAGYVLDYPERPADPGFGWIGTLGVRRAWRRRGLGEALLHRSFAALHARGYRRVRLGVDTENTTGATRLYERVGMHAIRRQNTWQLEL